MNKRYTIREVADLIGISTDAIRLYEKEGLVTPHRDPQNAYRYYEAYDIQRILGIYLHRQLNVSIPEIRNIYEVETLPEISDSFSEFITQAEDEIQNLQIKLEKLRFMKQHIDNLNEDNDFKEYVKSLIVRDKYRLIKNDDIGKVKKKQKKN